MSIYTGHAIATIVHDIYKDRRMFMAVRRANS
jgi:hypothetical protein